MNNSVLVIEDSMDIRENAAELLELAGYKVYTANNGKDGLDRARKDRPDLILCDMKMPDLDGYGILKAIESLPGMIGTPFVFITAQPEKADVRKGMDLSMNDYLIKPFESMDLLRTVSLRLKKCPPKPRYSTPYEGFNNFIDTVKTPQNIKIISENRTIKKIRRKDYVYLDGGMSKYLYFVVSGKVKTYKTNGLGKEYITEIHGEGDFFGHMALLDVNEYKESAVALENTEIALIPQKDFFELLNSSSEASLKFIRFMSTSLMQAEEKLIKMAYNSARKKVAEAIIFIYNKYRNDDPENFIFPANRENISAIAGIAPESVSRNLTDLKEEGLIESNNGMVRILNLKKLKDLKN